MADKTNLVTEANESDNTLSKSVTVQKPGDANNDGSINLADFSILNNNWGLSNRTLAQGDFNGDGLVNLADFSILNNNWGK
jgi:subtilase family serine protease